MRLQRLARFVVSFWVATVSVRAETPLNQARATLDKWVETRQLISKTAADWQSDKELLEQTIQLYERELKSVEDQMARLGTNSAQVEKERIQAEALLASSNESLERARQFSADFEARIAKLAPRLALPLQEALRPFLARMPSDPADTKSPAMDRIQVIVGALNELDKFNSAVTIFNEKRKNQKGEEVAVETVYVGLGAAYFVNDAGDFAGMGSSGPDGWEWTVRSDLASAVRETIRIYRNERPARFVPLPVVIQ